MTPPPDNNVNFNFQKFAIFLKSFWGILAVLSAALPTIIFILKTDLISGSILSQYYITIPTTFSILVIPFIFLYQDRLSDLKNARQNSVLFILLSIVLIFGFLIVKTKFVTDTYYTTYTNPNEKINQTLRDSTVAGVTRICKVLTKNSSDGKIANSYFQCTNMTDPVKQENSVNNFELLSVALYTLSILFTTLSFSSLGIFFYTRQLL
jgi:hypothetical protein